MFMLSTSNSIFKGMNPATVKTYFKMLATHLLSIWPGDGAGDLSDSVFINLLI
jgi:hypothetical protein